MLICFACLGQAFAQQVIVARDDTPATVPPPVKKPVVLQPFIAQPQTPAKQDVAKTQPVREPIVRTQPIGPKPAVVDKAKPQPNVVLTTHASSATPVPQTSPAKTQLAVTTLTSAPAKLVKPAGSMPDPHSMHLTKVDGPVSEPHPQLPLSSHESTSRILRMPMETAFVKVADGFDFPIGKPDAQGYYKARGFRSHGHLGEDWDGIRGGDTDLGDPIYCIGDGIVVFARDCKMGWGNVVIIRHSYRDGGFVKNVDSLYGHLDRMLVHRGQVISRGQQIATMGNAHGLYDAHLHLEIRKNIEIGMSRAKFAQDSTNYYDPTQFINAHRHLQGGGSSYRVAMNTFVQDSRINWAAVHNYSHSHNRGGTHESAAALKKAVAKGN
jgi:hypothetical protein